MNADFMNEYLTDVEYSDLSFVVPSSCLMPAANHQAQHQLGQMSLDKDLFGDDNPNPFESTISPFWPPLSNDGSPSNDESSRNPNSELFDSLGEDHSGEDHHSGDEHLAEFLEQDHYEIVPETEPTPPESQPQADESMPFLPMPESPMGRENNDQPSSFSASNEASASTELDILQPLSALKWEDSDDRISLSEIVEPPQPQAKKKRKRPTSACADKARRQRFLERNRLAASKCRRKKKEAELALEGQFQQLDYRRDMLKQQHASLVSEFLHLRSLAFQHVACGDASLTQWAEKRSHRLDATVGRYMPKGSEADAAQLPPLHPAVEPQQEVLSRPLVSLQPQQIHLPLLQQPQLMQHQPPPPSFANTTGVPLETYELSATHTPLPSSGFDQSPRMCPDDYPMMHPTHSRNASNASMTSYASSHFTMSDHFASRKSSDSGYSFNVSPISPLFDEIPDGLNRAESSLFNMLSDSN